MPLFTVTGVVHLAVHTVVDAPDEETALDIAYERADADLVVMDPAQEGAMQRAFVAVDVLDDVFEMDVR